MKKDFVKLLWAIGALSQEKFEGTAYFQKCYDVCFDIYYNENKGVSERRRALTALQQVLSKGVADPEEVRLQFAEALPEMLDKMFWDRYVENGSNNLPTPLTSFIDCLYHNRQCIED